MRGWELLRFVVAFGAPGDVVGVAEGVDVEDVDVGRGEEEVLNELARDGQTGHIGVYVNALTDVNMCHGSKKRNDTTNQRT